MPARRLLPLLFGLTLATALSPSARAQFDAASLRKIDAIEEQTPALATPTTTEAAPIVERRGRHRRPTDEERGDASGVRAIIAKHAAAHGVPAALADAVARIESRYNPRAAHAGNFGLMQIRLQTARGEGYGGSAQGLLDLETNANFGIKHLARAYRMADGDTCGTVMRYQGGLRATRMSGAARAYCARVKTLMGTSTAANISSPARRGL